MPVTYDLTGHVADMSKSTRMPSRPGEFHPEHRVAGGGRPPPAPTERGVRISRTTLFGSWFTAFTARPPIEAASPAAKWHTGLRPASRACRGDGVGILDLIRLETRAVCPSPQHR